MREYKLSGWPELSGEFERMAFRRALHEMSHRYATVRDLSSKCGLPRTAVRQFVVQLNALGLIEQRRRAWWPRIRHTLRPMMQWCAASFPSPLRF